MLFRAGRTKRLVLLSAWGNKVVVGVFSAGFPVRAGEWGCRSFLRRGVRHEVSVPYSVIYDVAAGNITALRLYFTGPAQS